MLAIRRSLFVQAVLTISFIRYETVYNQPIYSAVVSKLQYVEEAVKNQAPPKPKDDKPKQEKAPKAAAKPKAKVCKYKIQSCQTYHMACVNLLNEPSENFC